MSETEKRIPKLKDGTPVSHKWVLIHCSAQTGMMGPDSHHFVALIEELSRSEREVARLKEQLEDLQSRLNVAIGAAKEWPERNRVLREQNRRKNEQLDACRKALEWISTQCEGAARTSALIALSQPDRRTR
jgi:hypothetical protein